MPKASQTQTKSKTEEVKPEFRTLSLETREINEEERTVDLSFSSETMEVERYWGVEVLDHSPDSVRLGRLADKGPLLMDHNPRDQIGVIESVSIGTDRVGRAVVRFGKSDRAEEIFNDVKDGIRTKISVGYRVHRVVLQESTEEKEIYRVMDWEPFELSVVSIPADNQVGIGRNLESNQCEFMGIKTMPQAKKPEENNEEKRTIETPAVTVPETPVISDSERNAAVIETRDNELKRINDIGILCREHKAGAEIQDKALKEGWDLNKTRSAILDSYKKAPEEITRGQSADINLDEHKEAYSIRKAIIACSKNDWTGAEFEREVSEEMARQIGQEANGFYVPPSAFAALSRTMTKGVDAAGGYLVGTDHRPDMFIDALRNTSVVLENGATVLDGLVGDVDIPALDGSASFGWVAEEGDSTLSDGTTGTRVLSAKTVTGSVRMSRRLLKQSSPSVEAMMLNDLVRGAAIAIDKAALEGGGANEPTGIATTAGVNVQTVADVGNIPTWAEAVGFESKVAEDNALSGSPIYVTGANIAGGMKTAQKDAGSGLFVMENGMVNGYDVKVRNGLTAGRIIFGNMSDLLIGMWGALDILPDPYTDSQKGGLILRVFQDVDVAVRHAESFCIDG